MIKCFGIHSKQKVYTGTMTPVMGVRKTSSDIPRMCKHIWPKIFLKKPMQECRDARKFQVSTTNNKEVTAI